MDPNTTLARIRDLLDESRGARHLLSAEEYADQLAENVRALDEWLSRGGFPPAAWARNTGV